MTATTRDREDDVDASDEISWGDRSAFGSTRGVAWWVAVLIALGVSIVGAVADMVANGSLSTLFEGGYVIGCVAGVCLVRRRNIFGPIVQPPLVLVITVPLVVLLTKSPSGGLTAKALAVGTPLINAFPTMAIATGLTVVIGGIRLATQRSPHRADENRSENRTSVRPRTRPEDGGRRAGDRERDRGANPVARRSAAGAPRAAQDRAAQDRATPDRANQRDRTRANPARGRSAGSPRGDQPGRADQGERRGQPERGRGRGQVPRERNPRREPPRRRNDDY
ncbi:MAG TPA: DUF6542 domain-containing protein [Pseudonocardiaceae bacterium]|nr:DUF6542 domain-containing protein [Pseudonocardiaceae bacterium]